MYQLHLAGFLTRLFRYAFPFTVAQIVSAINRHTATGIVPDSNRIPSLYIPSDVHHQMLREYKNYFAEISQRGNFDCWGTFSAPGVPQRSGNVHSGTKWASGVPWRRLSVPKSKKGYCILQYPLYPFVFPISFLFGPRLNLLSEILR